MECCNLMWTIQIQMHRAMDTVKQKIHLLFEGINLGQFSSQTKTIAEIIVAKEYNGRSQSHNLVDSTWI